ncbi:MAG: Nudix family hydrolase [Rhodanobacteraceae bacterium]|nr:Nudix family hydrolase [Rhodanobacteraceae bacterium]MBK7044637.1 Nudix family hydrolase [Rhodanobacteraceae bacterium]MBP9153324.1 Nudix family hydrolase [Xanthomonadales bacterium]HQW81030.1 Nudix family hydrolase [Pseudomonadota bacterium]
MLVVAAILEDASGRVLLAQRPAGKQHAGLWEFPGGKIELGESGFDALRRELHEELGIDIVSASRFMCVRRQRSFGTLVLDAWRVSAWLGEAVANEHSALIWRHPQEASTLPLCEADVPICRAAGWPARYAITPDPGSEVSEHYLAQIKDGLRRGIGLLQWRAPSLAAAKYREAAITLRTLAHAHGARLLLNATPELALELGADGVHLNAARLRSTAPSSLSCAANFLVAASVHDAQELAQAEAIGADFVVISPVRATPSHPLATPIGWNGFQSLLMRGDLPAYALGGLGPEDVTEARQQGALGVAGISAFW